MEIPDDVWRRILHASQASGTFKIITMVDVDDDDRTIESVICVTKKTEAIRALACASKQIHSLQKEVLRCIGRKNYFMFPKFGSLERVAFIEFAN